MIKLGIVGAGIIGKDHEQVIRDNPDCILTAVCDTVEERAREIAANHNAEVYTDYKEMCEKADMDAVILNLPHFLHHDATVYFLEKGIHVLVEKPMAMTVEECDSMIAASKKSGAKLAIGHVQRYFSAYGEIKKIKESGKYGKLCMITEVRNMNYINPNRPKWFLDKKLSGGGIVMNFGAHSLDKIMYVTGEKVEEIRGYLDNPITDDTIEVNAQILLKLTGNITANITFCGCPGVSAYETIFYFDHGVAKVVSGTQLYLSEDGKFVPYGGNTFALPGQLEEFVKFLKGEESMIVTPEYGREIIRVLQQVL